ncbi:scoloptoxin SSD14-like isoform X2 [Coccinella septempunctata]|uniref:scoloptoxin SSD14-like isoform X2 n=1 Tax=Coccinella septempunctata TaxID=41139 RepID=UPI001D070853|nr:scoloptoxin SSD14-like isoform X2 [Coccinella septempunctata]
MIFFTFFSKQFKSKKVLFVSGIVAVILAAVVIVLFIIFLPPGDKTRIGAIVTNGKLCADIGTSIINKGGKAVDGAIAALFCEGVSMPQSCGLGGGFLMLIYDKESGEVHALDTRETAPAAAYEDMFHGDSSLSVRGILSVAVPGELRGYWMAYKRFGGGVPWKDIVQPTIDLCRNGIPVTKYLEGIFALNKQWLMADPNLKESFINPLTNDTYKEGQQIRRLKFAKTLEVIAEEGGEALNNGTLTDQLVEDIHKLGGIITKKDLVEYSPVWVDPIKVTLPFNQTLYTVPLPGSGALLVYILNMLQLQMDLSDPESLLNLQRTVESFKFAYGSRTLLGDTRTPEMDEFVKDLASLDVAKRTVTKIKDNETSQDPTYYGAQISNPDNHGTAHISVLAPNGDAVSVTTTINQYFGSGVSAEHSDVILNDEMDDFSSPGIVSNFDIPPSKNNYIEPGKRPLSSMCPTIVLDKDKDVKLVIGSAGGTKITTAVALGIVNHLWFDMDIRDAIDNCRIHHQLFPMAVQAEECFRTDEFQNYMGGIGHQILFKGSDGFSAVTSVSNKSDISASFDKRRPGDISYIYG